MDGEIGFNGDDDDIDDIGYIDGGLNEFGGEEDGENAPSFISTQLLLYPSLFRLFDGIIDGLNVLEIEVEDNDDLRDVDDAFDEFKLFWDDAFSSSLSLLSLSLNLLLFEIFGEKMDGEFVVNVGDVNDGLFGEFDGDLVDWGLLDDDGCISSISSSSISLSLLFIDGMCWINGGEIVFVGDDDNDDMIGDFGGDLVGFCERRDGANWSPIPIPPILLFLI